MQLRTFCDRIVEEHEDALAAAIRAGALDGLDASLCVGAARMCESADQFAELPRCATRAARALSGRKLSPPPSRSLRYARKAAAQATAKRDGLPDPVKEEEAAEKREKTAARKARKRERRKKKYPAGYEETAEQKRKRKREAKAAEL